MHTEVGDLDDVIERTEGMSAAFLKELGRRAALVAAEASEPSEELVVRHGDIVAALDDLLEHSTPILRSMLGASPDQAAQAFLVAGHGMMMHGPPFMSHASTMMIRTGSVDFTGDFDDE